MVAELTARGLIQLGESAVIEVDERSGFPVVSVGRRVTSEDVASGSSLATLDAGLAQELPELTTLVPSPGTVPPPRR